MAEFEPVLMRNVGVKDSRRLAVYRSRGGYAAARKVITDWTPEQTVEAAKESGYSEEHIRRLVRNGKLEHQRNSGRHTHIRIRRCDLPKRIVYCRKNGGHSAADTQYNPEEDARNIAQRLGGLDG